VVSSPGSLGAKAFQLNVDPDGEGVMGPENNSSTIWSRINDKGRTKLKEKTRAAGVGHRRAKGLEKTFILYEIFDSKGLKGKTLLISSGVKEMVLG